MLASGAPSEICNSFCNSSWHSHLLTLNYLCARFKRSFHCFQFNCRHIYCNQNAPCDVGQNAVGNSSISISRFTSSLNTITVSYFSTHHVFSRVVFDNTWQIWVSCSRPLPQSRIFCFTTCVFLNLESIGCYVHARAGPAVAKLLPPGRCYMLHAPLPAGHCRYTRPPSASFNCTQLHCLSLHSATLQCNTQHCILR